MPPPNAAGKENGTRNNFVASGSEIFDNDTFDVRIDNRFSDNLNMFGRYSFADYTRDGPPAFGQGGGLELVSLGGTSKVRNHSLAIGFDYTLSPQMLVDFRFGYFKYGVNVLPFDFGTPPAADAGIPGLNLDDFLLGPVRRVSFERRSAVSTSARAWGQPLQLPARSARETVPVGRQSAEDPGQSHVQVRR